MHEDASDAQRSRKRRSTIHVVHPLAHLFGCPAINDHEKPEHRDKSKGSHLNQQLQIVIVGSIHEKIRIETAKLRIYIWEHTQSPSQ